jgi:hypothetical protein
MIRNFRHIILKCAVIGTLTCITLATSQIVVSLAAESNERTQQLLPSRDDIARDTATDMAKEDKEDKDQMASLATTIREGEVVMRGGQRYRAFHSQAGTLLVPLTGKDIRPEDFEASLCKSNPESAANPETRMVAGVEKPLSKKLSAYAGLMAKVFRQKCGTRDNAPKNPAKVTPEFGLEWDNDSKSGGKDKVFLSPMGAGFGTSF